MKKYFTLTLLGLSVITLSACVKQEDADIKMAKGCAAGVASLIAPHEIAEIKVKRYADEDVKGGLHRRVTLEAVEKDGWLELDKTYSCLFMQQWGLFKSSHEALLVQIKVDNRVIGKRDGKIIGDFDDFLKLTRVVDAAMGQ